MRVNAMTDMGRVRTENQDNYRVGVLPHGAAWGVVCDGMGGGYDGSKASTAAVDAIAQLLMEKLQTETPPEEIESLMLQAIRRANDDVFEHSGRGRRVMGTTVVCAVLQDGHLHLAHAGDSRAYLFKDGGLTQLTRDHSVVQELLDKGSITPGEVALHPEKNVITRALGVDSIVEIDYERHPLENGVFMLCTDGLTNMVPDDRLVQILTQTDFYNLSKELVSEALQCGGQDNITVVLIENGEAENDAG